MNHTDSPTRTSSSQNAMREGFLYLLSRRIAWVQFTWSYLFTFPQRLFVLLINGLLDVFLLVYVPLSSVLCHNWNDGSVPVFSFWILLCFSINDLSLQAQVSVSLLTELGSVLTSAPHLLGHHVAKAAWCATPTGT